MSDLLRTLGNALFFQDEAYARLRDAKDNFARGLLIIVAISLIVGLFNSLADYMTLVRTSPSAQVAEARAGMQQAFEQLERMGVFGTNPVFDEQFRRNMEAGFAIGEAVAEVVEETTRLPYPVVVAFRVLGGWLSYPFGWISRWMLYTLVVLVFAKLLGGTATVREMLATTSLVVVPHLLDAFRFLPIVGGLLSLVAFVWGVAVYVKGIAVANRFGIERALLAALAPILLLVGLAILVLIALAILFAIAAGGR